MFIPLWVFGLVAAIFIGPWLVVGAVVLASDVVNSIWPPPRGKIRDPLGEELERLARERR